MITISFKISKHHNAMFLFLFWLMTSDDQTSIHSSGDALSHQHRKWFDMFLLVLRLDFRVTLDSVTSQSTCMCIIIQLYTLMYSRQYQRLEFLATWFKVVTFLSPKIWRSLSQPLGHNFTIPKKVKELPGGMFSQHLVLGFLRGGGVQGEGATEEKP